MERSRAGELSLVAFETGARRDRFDLEYAFRGRAGGRLRLTADRERLGGTPFRWRLRDLDDFFFISLPTSVTLLHFIGTADVTERESKGQYAGSWVMGS